MDEPTVVRDIRSRPHYFDFLVWVLRMAWTEGIRVNVRQMVSPDIKIVICLVADPYFLHTLIIFCFPSEQMCESVN